MGTRQNFRSLFRELLDETKKRSEREKDDRWMQGTDDSLMLDEPGTMVSDDARSKISHFLKTMGLMK